MRQGRLFIVGGPIGNLSDISERAVNTLSAVDIILSEDTRDTDKILKDRGINKKQISYRDENHTRIIQKIISALDDGLDLAYVTDNGTPGISDPGYKLVREVKEQGYEVLAVPGPSAVTAALSVAGVPTDNFAFIGFLPKKPGKRKKELEKFGKLPATLVIYESPFRIVKLLKEIKEILGNREVCLCNELTKIHENSILAPVDSHLEHFATTKPKGEFTVLISKDLTNE